MNIKSTSFIELNKLALINNIDFLKSVTGPGTIISSVVKSNAYGHGISYFVPLVEDCGISHFSVFSSGEARQVLKACRNKCTVVIMGYINPEDMDWVLENRVEFYVYNPQRLRELVESTGKARARIHIELETGLHRTGFERSELPEVIQIIKNYPEKVEVAGTCTHLAGAEVVSNYYRILNQIRIFNELAGILEAGGVNVGLRHMACSAAIFNYPETIMDMVRVGIAQYGFWSSRETRIRYLQRGSEDGITKTPDPLRRVLSWKSKVMDIKEISEGDYISYGYGFLATRPMVIASVPVGYAHGYARQISNAGHVLIQSCRAGVVGIINMNMMLVDITDIPGVKVGDEVVLIGEQGEAEISVASFSDMVNNLNYETLVRLPSEIRRNITETTLKPRRDEESMPHTEIKR